MTNISVLADTKNGGKKGVVSEYMYADTVILDAELTFGLPPRAHRHDLALTLSFMPWNPSAASLRPRSPTP